jgi:hypothetical protein
MTAAMLVLDPIFEADLPPEQYAYRQGRNAQQAVIDVEETLFHGHREIVDADLADYFGSIPHADLMRSLARRIVDARVLHLIKMWLECSVEETDDKGRKTRTTEAKDHKRGIPQGSPITPLTQKVISGSRAAFETPGGRRRAVGWGRRRERDAVPNDDRVVADQNVLDDESHDALPFRDIESVGGAAQSRQERCESLCQAQEHGAIVSLVGDRLQLGACRLLSVTQRRHSLAQLLQRYELFLIGVEKPFDALANTSQFSLQALLALLRWIGSSCRRERGCPDFCVIGPYFPREGCHADQERDCRGAAEGSGPEEGVFL